MWTSFCKKIKIGTETMTRITPMPKKIKLATEIERDNSSLRNAKDSPHNAMKTDSPINQTIPVFQGDHSNEIETATRIANKPPPVMKTPTTTSFIWESQQSFVWESQQSDPTPHCRNDPKQTPEMPITSNTNNKKPIS